MHLVGRLPAPAVRAEGDALLFISRQPPEIGEEGGHGGHHVVVEGGGADGDILGGHGVGDDVGIVAVVQVVQAGLEAAGEEPALDGVRHRLGGVPHGVKDDDGGVVVFPARPALVQGEDVGDVLRPDDAVAGADGPDGQPRAGGERLARLHAVRLHDVGVVLARLDIRLGQVALGVQPLVGGVVLAEGVVGKEDVLRRHKGDHVVRPVHHGRGHEREGALADAQLFARLHAGIAQIAVVGGKVLHARAEGRVHLGVFRHLQDLRQAAAVVGFGVVGDDHVDLGRVDDGRDALQHLAEKAFLHRVDEGDLFIDDEVGVVGRALLRLVAVEIA